jgi:GAF domain-containing protein
MISNEHLQEIVRLGSELNTVQDLDILLEKILYEARHCFSADAGSIYVRESDFLVFSNVQNDTLQRKLPEGQKLAYTRFKVPINRQSISGFVAATGQVLNIPDVYNIPADASFHFDSHYATISHYRTHSMLTVPMLTNRGSVIGVLQLINALDAAGNPVSFDREGEPFAVYLANTASMILERARMTRAILLRMISMAELRDPKETGAHVNR